MAYYEEFEVGFVARPYPSRVFQAPSVRDGSQGEQSELHLRPPDRLEGGRDALPKPTRISAKLVPEHV